jgi:hypothetical protein
MAPFHLTGLPALRVSNTHRATAGAGEPPERTFLVPRLYWLPQGWIGLTQFFTEPLRSRHFIARFHRKAATSFSPLSASGRELGVGWHGPDTRGRTLLFALPQGLFSKKQWLRTFFDFVICLRICLSAGAFEAKCRVTLHEPFPDQKRCHFHSAV